MPQIMMPPAGLQPPQQQPFGLPPMLPAERPAAAASAAACQLRGYLLEQQQRAALQQRIALDKQRLALDLWLAQLQKDEAGLAAAAAASAAAPAAFWEEPASPMSVAPRIASNTSTMSHATAVGAPWLGLGDCDAVAPPPAVAEQLRMFPAPGGAVRPGGGLLDSWLASMPSRPASPARLGGFGALF
jgi:hypothetical protein